MPAYPILPALLHLYRIVDASEKGFATAAVNMPDPAIKIMLKDFAGQRARFKTALLEEGLGAGVRAGYSLPGMIHRGRVAIFAAMTIEEDRRAQVVLKEAAVGEKVAVQAYEQALRKALPGETQALLEQQLGQVRRSRDQISLLLGRGSQQLVAHVYDSADHAQAAIQSLQAAGFPPGALERIPLQAQNQYTGRGASVAETALSGAFGGALWGGLTGVLVGLGVAETSLANPFRLAQVDVLGLAVLSFVLMGIFVGAMLGLFIGAGISEEARQPVQAAQDAAVLVKANIDPGRVREARLLLAQAGTMPEQAVLKEIRE